MKALPLLEQAPPLLEQALPLLEQALPLLEQALPLQVWKKTMRFFTSSGKARAQQPEIPMDPAMTEGSFGFHDVRGFWRVQEKQQQQAPR